MEVISVIIVAVDVAKDKHDCFITNTDGEVLFDPFVIQNNQDGFDDLYQKICSVADSTQNVKVGLEATGHYHLNLLGYLLDKGLTTCLINPLQTSLFRKSLSFRKTKTDPVDARAIARLLMSDRTLQPYSLTSYQNEELKSLTRYRADKVRERARLKSSLSRLVVILFPELEKLVPILHMATVYDLLREFPGASYVASAHLTRLCHLISDSSKGHYGREKALEIREAARHSTLFFRPNLLNCVTRSITSAFWMMRSMRSKPRSLPFWIKIRRRCWASQASARVWRPLSSQKQVTLSAFPHRISSWPMLACLLRLTSPDS